MAAATRPPEIRGLRLAVDDVDEAASLFRSVFPMAPAAHASRFGFGNRWVEAHAAPVDALDMRSSDLPAQREHLRRLGIDPLDGTALGCAPCLRLEVMDTGASVVNLRAGDAHDRPAQPGNTTELRGVQLAVRAPERVALHWAQLFHGRPVRGEDGLPALDFGGFTLRFALAQEERRGVSALEFGVDDLTEPLRCAASRGLRVTRGAEDCEAAFSALGLELRFGPLS